jgi:3-oxoacyl-[acyl-carrier protein] reductase
MPSKTLNDWSIGDSATIEHTIEQRDVDAFASFTGDYNPLHVDPEYASTTDFQRPVVHGMLNASFISTLIGMKLPGPGALWTSQTLEFIAPAYVGDKVLITGRIKHISKGTNSLSIAVIAVNQKNEELLRGDAVVKFLKQRDPKIMNDTNKKKYLILGGSGGIGQALIQDIIDDCESITYTYLNTFESIEDPKIRAIKCDLGSPEDISSLISELLNTARPYDGVIHFASGTPKIAEIKDCEWSDYERQLAVNVGSLQRVVKALLSGGLLESGASIVAISTVYTKGTPPINQSPYVTAKYALNGYCKTLASEIGPKGIRVNLVAPGMVYTRMLSSVPDKTKLYAKMNTPLRRLADPKDVTGAIRFLLSADSIHVTGSVIDVSGGYEM